MQLDKEENLMAVVDMVLPSSLPLTPQRDLSSRKGERHVSCDILFRIGCIRALSCSRQITAEGKTILLSFANHPWEVPAMNLWAALKMLARKWGTSKYLHLSRVAGGVADSCAR